jgi:hypothetical protein
MGDSEEDMGDKEKNIIGKEENMVDKKENMKPTLLITDREQHTELILFIESLQAVQITERERKTWR